MKKCKASLALRNDGLFAKSGWSQKTWSRCYDRVGQSFRILLDSRPASGVGHMERTANIRSLPRPENCAGGASKDMDPRDSVDLREPDAAECPWDCTYSRRKPATAVHLGTRFSIAKQRALSMKNLHWVHHPRKTDPSSHHTSVSPEFSNCLLQFFVN